jgi:hypothetical protein
MRQVPPPTFCDDFDRDSPAPYGWHPLSDLTTLQDETLTYASAPNSFLSVLDPDAGRYATMTRVFAGNWNKVYLAFAIRTGGLDGGWVGPPQGAEVGWWSFGNGSDPHDCGYLFVVGPNDAKVQVQRPDLSFVETVPLRFYPLTGKWGTVQVVLESTDGGLSFSMFMDDAGTVDPHSSDQCRLRDSFTFTPGLWDITAPAEVRFDNVRIDLQAQ